MHVHFALHIAEADSDDAVASLRAAGVEVTEHAFGTAPRLARRLRRTSPDGHLVELWTWDVAGSTRR